MKNKIFMGMIVSFLFFTNNVLAQQSPGFVEDNATRWIIVTACLKEVAVLQRSVTAVG